MYWKRKRLFLASCSWQKDETWSCCTMYKYNSAIKKLPHNHTGGARTFVTCHFFVWFMPRMRQRMQRPSLVRLPRMWLKKRCPMAVHQLLVRERVKRRFYQEMLGKLWWQLKSEDRSAFYAKKRLVGFRTAISLSPWLVERCHFACLAFLPLCLKMCLWTSLLLFDNLLDSGMSWMRPSQTKTTAILQMWRWSSKPEKIWATSNWKQPVITSCRKNSAWTLRRRGSSCFSWREISINTRQPLITWSSTCGTERRWLSRRWDSLRISSDLLKCGVCVCVCVCVCVGCEWLTTNCRWSTTFHKQGLQITSTLCEMAIFLSRFCRTWAKRYVITS